MSNTTLYFHPQYLATKAGIEQARDMYHGDQDTMKASKYLWLHELEIGKDGSNIRKIREQRSSYTNFIEPIISIWTSLFFRKDPEIPDAVTELLGDSIDNIDGQGTSLISFIRDKLLVNSLLYGRPVLRVNALGEAPKTKAEEANPKNFKPYFEMIDPLQFVDWQVENKDPSMLNKLVFCRIEFERMMDRATAESPIVMEVISKQYILQGNTILIKEYKLQNKDNKTAYNEDKNKFADSRCWELVKEETLSGWDELPFVVDIRDESWVKDVLPHALKYFNLESVIDNVSLFQSHQRVYFIGDGIEQKDIGAVAEYTVQALPAGTTIHTIEPTNLAGVESRLAQVLNNIFRIALNQVRMMSADSAAVQGSETQREEKDLMFALVQSEMEAIENMVNEGIRLFAKFKGDDNFDEKISLNGLVSEQNIERMIQLILAFRDEVTRLPETRKALLNWFIEQIDLPEKAELKKEIEAKVTDAVVNPQAITDNFYRGFNGNSQRTASTTTTTASRNGS